MCKLKEICERLRIITENRNKNGYMDRNSVLANEREVIIAIFVKLLRAEMPNVKNGVLSTNIAWRTPDINSLRFKSVIIKESAQRIAWELFDTQFSREMRKLTLGVENDPFYENGVITMVSDSDRMVIDSQKASAERCYRTLIRNMRACYVSKDLSGSLGVE